MKSLNGQPLTAAMVDEIAYNGTLIVQTLIHKIEYKSKYKFKNNKFNILNSVCFVLKKKKKK